MGMFDDKRYLTGENGMFKSQDRLHLHNAKLGGMVSTPNGHKREAILSVSRDGNDPVTIYTTGAAIVGQVERMDDGDRAKMPMRVVLDTLDTGKGNPAFILRPESPPAETTF